MSEIDWDLFSSYAGLLSLASFSIYVGSFGSLPNPKRTKTKGPEQDGEESDDDDDWETDERVSPEDAWLFPIIGSIALGGLYLVIKYLGKEWINWFLGWYFSLAGIGSVWKSLISLFRFLYGSQRWKQFERLSFEVKRGRSGLLRLSWRTPSVLLFPIALIPSALYKFLPSARKSALLSDLLALSFSHNALSLLKLDSFKTGCIMLSGLFLYDIWWVFGTDVMVSVATNLDVPIKLLWPKAVNFSSTERGYTMLGLGDVVVPGLFIALSLRYDYYRSTKSTTNKKGAFGKPYFYASIIAYIMGLMTTMGVMHFFRAAQPALLYLSPACIMSFFVIAVTRGELKDAWGWTDGPEEEEKKEKDKNDPPEASTSRQKSE